MKVFRYYTVITAFLFLILAIVLSMLYPKASLGDIWVGFFFIPSFILIGIPWLVYLLLKIGCFTVYEVRKAWLKAEQDSKK